MEIKHELKNDVLIIHLSSERLDVSDAAQFKHKILDLINKEENFHVIFDLSKLNFIDSSGVGMFLSILRFLNSRGGELKLASLTQPIRTILELVSIHKIFEIFKTVEDAISSFNPNLPSHSQR